MRLFVSGGAGFIGSNFVRHFLAAVPTARIVVADSLTYAGNLGNLEGVPVERYKFHRADICSPEAAGLMDGCDAAINFAAESHVDRSIEDSSDFIRTNIEGTRNLLDACRRKKVPRFLQVSTDEVYGSLLQGSFSETSPLAPNSPYAASKAAADLLVLSYIKTYAMPALITRCSNNYGPFQFPEKFIPLMIVQANAGKTLPVYGDGMNVRDWIHVEDHCAALTAILLKGRDAEVYNIGGGAELKNLDVAKMILRLLQKDEGSIRFVTDRLGHDRRYSVDCNKLKKELGWSPKHEFSAGLESTVAWYQEHAAWLDSVTSGEYRTYFDKHYVHRDDFIGQIKFAKTGVAD